MVGVQFKEKVKVATIKTCEVRHGHDFLGKEIAPKFCLQSMQLWKHWDYGFCTWQNKLVNHSRRVKYIKSL